MAFTQETFAPIGGQSTAAPSIWSYITQDTLAETISALYFIDKQYQLNVGDEIFIVASDGGGNYAYTGPTQPLFDVTSGSPREIIKCDMVLNAFSTATQNPAGTDAPLKVTFGAAQGAVDDAVMIDALGTITFNQDGCYTGTFVFQIARTGAAGVSHIWVAFFANGVIQVGKSKRYELNGSDDDASHAIPFSINVPAGTTFHAEIMRDSAGNNSGGLVSTQATTVAWADTASAEVLIHRYTLEDAVI